MEKQRYFFLDLARVFALICIIWCHTNVVEFDSYFLEKAKCFFGRCGVPLFFIVSGYLAFPQKKPLKQYFTQKVKRIVIPFCLWLLIYYVAAYASSKPMVVNGDILNEGSAHLWFIYVIIGFYIMVPVLNPFLHSVSRKVLKAYLLLWGITTLYPLILFKLAMPFTENSCLYTFNYLYGYVGYFLLGNYIQKYGDDTWMLKWVATLLCFVMSIALVGIYFFVFDCKTLIVNDYKGLPMLLYTIAMLGLIKRISPYIENSLFRKNIVSLSIYSFGIYLCHMLVVLYLYPLIPICHGVPDLLVTGCFVTINIVLSFVFVYILSKFRITRYLIG